MPSFLVPIHEFNPCHTSAGQPTGGRFCSEGIPGRNEALIAASKQSLDVQNREGLTYESKEGLTATQQAKVDQTLTATLNAPGTQIMVRVPEEVLPLILADGRVKNQFESGQSRGYIDVGAMNTDAYTRRAVEKVVMGVDPAFPPRDRPVYGLVTGVLRGGESGQSYGEVQLELRPEVRARTTVTVGDSFAFDTGRAVDSPSGIAEPILHPTWRIIGASRRVRFVDKMTGADPNDPENGRDALNGLYPSYVEAQIHGGLKLSDVARIHVEGVSTIERLAPALAAHGWHETTKNKGNERPEDLKLMSWRPDESTWERNP